jgi:hypothetical protein
MKNKTLRIITISQLSILLLLLLLTLGNEILDIPHYVFHDTPTLYSQRTGEIIIELSLFFIVMAFEAALLKNLYKRIRLLEGFLPICANCKKIRTTEDHWEQIEQYITKHSLAQFSHSICPDCARELYPDLYRNKE